MLELDPTIPAEMVEKEAPVLRTGDKVNSVLHQKYKAVRSGFGPNRELSWLITHLIACLIWLGARQQKWRGCRAAADKL